MGAGNVKLAYALWRDLPHAAFRAFGYMALRSMDTDVPPVFYGGREELAAALGRAVPSRDDDDPAVVKDRRAAFGRVDRALEDLVKAGAITTVQTAGRWRPAKYALNLPRDSTTVSVVLQDHGERGAKDHGERGVSTTVSVTKDHGERGAQEKKEKGGLIEGESGGGHLQPAGVAHAREAEKDDHQQERAERAEQPTCPDCEAILDRDGSCFICRRKVS